MTSLLVPERVIAAHFNLMVPQTPADVPEPMSLVRAHGMKFFDLARHYRWFEAERGGHFAAMEQPQTFAGDLWGFEAAALARNS